MSIVFKPLAEKAETLSTFSKPYQQVYNQIADQITFTDLSPCPLCHNDQLVEYIQPHNNPEHGEYSVAISCRQCRIQTQPQHWFISEPTSATRALNAAIQNWQQLPRTTIMPTAAEASQAEFETNPVIASAAQQPEPDPVIPAQAGIQKSGVLISFQEYADWQQSKQDAARYQYIKENIFEESAEFHRGLEMHETTIFDRPKINRVDLAVKILECPLAHEENGKHRIDLDQTIDASIKQQAANP